MPLRENQRANPAISNENGAFADTKDEASRHHDFVGLAECRQRGAQHPDGGRPTGNARRTESIDRHAAEQCQSNVRYADDAVEDAQSGLAEAALPMQQIGDRSNDVVLVVAARDRKGCKQQDPPPQRGAAGHLAH
jgi:hypothetical protein